MNNPKSMLLGWGSLVAAAGVGYYFARQDINERRRQQQNAGSRPTEKLDSQIERDAASVVKDAPVTTEGTPRSTSSLPKSPDNVVNK
ncbi:hypothetical protein SCHPADRAFT_316233 [Schizopora paradoxa]|uniref:Uncharacterized protein n=1 Tax=Schizopora paradoxa TaxID=27342 RepID=A0A0H2RR33_9AGAM|nr:hypothetical protein SCHPADRAFT_316233 [Schizopora paradoxa]